jgi:hypothetical protein
MKLYGFPPTRSIRVLWMLRELGVDFEFVNVNLVAGENRRPEFLALNPAGRLPVLVDGDFVLTESVRTPESPPRASPRRSLASGREHLRTLVAEQDHAPANVRVSTSITANGWSSAHHPTMTPPVLPIP